MQRYISAAIWASLLWMRGVGRVIPIALVWLSIANNAWASPAVIFVDGSASGENNGVDWANAYCDVQDALDQAALLANLDSVEIWVARGTYRPDRGTGDRSMYYHLPAHVSIYGGFAGWETDRCDRYLEDNETIISGDLFADDVPASALTSNCCLQVSERPSGDPRTGCDDRSCEALVCEASPDCCDDRWGALCAAKAYSLCCPLCAETRCDNSKMLLYAGNVDGSSTIDSITFEGVYGYDPDWYGSSGADIPPTALDTGPGDAVIAHCTFRDNHADGYAAGIKIGSGSPTIEQCTFERNDATYGGAIAQSNSVEPGEPRIQNCIFRDNASRAASVAILHHSGEIRNCVFEDHHRGKGLELITMAGDTLTITDCQFINNIGRTVTETTWGDSLVIRGCTFTGNAGQGGFVSNNEGAAYLERCVFRDNPWPYLLTSSGALTVLNCVFAGNNAAQSHLLYTPLISLRGEPRFFNCLFVGNQTKSGNAIIEDGPGSPVHVHMANCLLLNNRAGGQGGEAAQIHIGRGNVSQELTIDFSIVSGWTGGLDGEGSFDADPLFVEPGHYDDNGTPDDYLDDTWVHGDYHVLPGSPAINAGDPNSGYYAWADDLDGHPRVRCGAVDIGVYEAGAGDADCDRSVGLVDFAFFNTCLTGPPHDADPWDTEAILDDACKAFDIDNNNHVDLADWAAFTELLAG